MKNKCAKIYYITTNTSMYQSKIFVFIILISLQILLVASQSTDIINDRSCKLDSDCVSDGDAKVSWLNKTDTRLGNFMCVNEKCKFVVAAGKPFFHLFFIML